MTDEVSDETQAMLDRSFMDNVREARENGFDVVCVICGVGVSDGLDIHERGCPLFVESNYR